MANTRSSLVNTNPLRKLSKALIMSKADNRHPRVVEMYKQWTRIYRTFIHNRFKTNSRGGGDWAPLSARRIQKRGHSRILIETNTLLNAVSPDIYNAPGSFARRQGNGLIVGYGGSVVHPTAAKSGRSTTIQEIAGFHQTGGGRLPQRRIIVGPDKATVELVTKEIQAAVQDILKEVRL